ncbi:MAG: hypothetical protein JRE63_13470 [Deltaproteobacteria bacterium]|nr:hypothetical protein [Deltaproteobacteria bacterium]
MPIAVLFSPLRRHPIRDFWLCFIPLFVAVDAIGVLPVFIMLTEKLETRHISGIVLQSVLTAWLAAISFLVFGQALLKFLSISISDFTIA